MSEREEIQPSATLAVLLDLWGQTVALRAGVIAQPEWVPGTNDPVQKAKAKPRQGPLRVTVREAIALSVGHVDPWWVRPVAPTNLETRRRLSKKRLAYIQRNHLGLNLTPWDLCRHWQRLIRTDSSFPRSASLSLSTRKMLNEMEGLPRRGSGVARVGDVRSIQCAHITICQLLLGHAGHRGATENMRSLVCWLHVVPWFADRPTDIASWCAARFGGQSSERLVEAMTDQYRRWVISANRYVQGSINCSWLDPASEQESATDDVVYIKVPLSEGTQRLPSKEALEADMLTLREFGVLFTRLALTLRLWALPDLSGEDTDQRLIS